MRASRLFEEMPPPEVEVFLNDRFTEEVAAQHLGLKKEGLRTKRKDGTGPRFTHFGKQIQYRVAWLEDFIDAHSEGPVYWPDAVRQEAPQVLRAA